MKIFYPLEKIKMRLQLLRFVVFYLVPGGRRGLIIDLNLFDTNNTKLYINFGVISWPWRQLNLKIICQAVSKALLVYIVCHHGNTSNKAATLLRTRLNDSSTARFCIRDLIGGMDQWSLEIDNCCRRYWMAFPAPIKSS